MYEYTIIGYYTDTMQRFATTTTAMNPKEAEYGILNKYSNIAVCGIIAGQHYCVDAYEFVQTADVCL